MVDKYTEIQGTYKINVAKDGERMMAIEIVEELNTLNEAYNGALMAVQILSRERNHLRAKLAEVYGELE